MRKLLLIFITVMLTVSNFMFASDNFYLQAADNKSYYSDGVSATWDDIAPYLSVLYRNTPYISLSNGQEVRTFYFNIELFWDLGLYVYGEPNSVQFTGTVNDFKATENGYFRSESNKSTFAGEYRYLGYSINGVPITNSRFPTEMQTDGSVISLIKYSDLPENLKTRYGVSNYSNEAYWAIRDLIESPLSPVWDFTTTINNEEVTLKQKLMQLGLYKNGLPGVALLDYGVVYSWAESGGVIRLFFRSGKYGEKYAYATFAGPVTVDFTTKYPNISSNMKIDGESQNKIGNNTFYMSSSEKQLIFDITLHGEMEDSFITLSDFAKKFTCTREEITDYSITIDNKETKTIDVDYLDSSVNFSSVLRGYKIYASQLVPGRNTIKIPGLLKVYFNKNNNVHCISAPCSVSITIIYKPNAPEATTPTPTSKPTPKATPEKFPEVTPVRTPRIEVNRRW